MQAHRREYGILFSNVVHLKGGEKAQNSKASLHKFEIIN